MIITWATVMDPKHWGGEVSYHWITPSGQWCFFSIPQSPVTDATTVGYCGA